MFYGLLGKNPVNGIPAQLIAAQLPILFIFSNPQFTSHA